MSAQPPQPVRDLPFVAVKMMQIDGPRDILLRQGAGLDPLFLFQGGQRGLENGRFGAPSSMPETLSKSSSAEKQVPLFA